MSSISKTITIIYNYNKGGHDLSSFVYVFQQDVQMTHCTIDIQHKVFRLRYSGSMNYERRKYVKKYVINFREILCSTHDNYSFLK